MKYIKIDRSIFSIRNPFIEVHYWYLEIHNQGKVNREIGFNNKGEPIVFLPNKSNPHGFWSDAPVTFDAEEWQKVDTFEFMSIWRVELNQDNPFL